MSSRIIRPDARLVQDFVPTVPALPTDEPVIQYIRQSSLKQVKHNRQSTILQDEKLTGRLVAYGWRDDLESIIKIDTDQGKSGQKRRDERAGLDYLYKLILGGKAGAVAAYDASRLYRDVTRVFYTDFVNMCETHGIVVITYDVIYWPNNRKDMDALIDRFAEAARFIDEVIYGKLIPAKNQAIEESVSYGGGAVPFGFLVKETEERKFFVVYEPHAELVRWIFKRYRQLGGNLGKLGRECREQGVAFPAFSGVGKIPYVALSFDGNGYPVRTRCVLVSILTNPAYIGWYVYNGVIASKKAHEPIVPMDDFLYAYTRLSNVTLDGEVNENKPKVERRYGAACDALLEGILENDGNSVYVMAHDQSYMARTNNDAWKSTELSVPVDFLDAEFTEILIPALMAAAARKQETGLEDGLNKLWQESYQEKTETAQDFTKQLAQIDKAIHGWELDKQSAREQEYKPGIDEANKQLKRLHEAKTALQTKAERASKEAGELAKSKDLTMQALHEWETMPFDRKQCFVRLAVEKANISVVAPHVLRLDIVLHDPFYFTDSRYIYRQHGSRTAWSTEDMDTLAAMYPQANKQAILEALPTRTWKNIIRQAGEMALVRGTRQHNTTVMHLSLSFADVTLLEALGFPASVTPDMAANLLPFVSISNDSPDHIRALVQNYCYLDLVRRELVVEYM